MSSGAVYILAEGVQVREEKFGLLFYDYRGPRLYFVPSKDLIQVEFFSGKKTVDDLVEKSSELHGWPPRALIRERLEQVLGTLQGKGLIHEQSVC